MDLRARTCAQQRRDNRLPFPALLDKMRPLLVSSPMVHFQGNAELLPVIGLGAGLLFFFRGLHFYRETLLLADTPAMPIRSVAMGLVQPQGTDKGRGGLPEPGERCSLLRLQGSH